METRWYSHSIENDISKSLRRTMCVYVYICELNVRCRLGIECAFISNLIILIELSNWWESWYRSNRIRWMKFHRMVFTFAYINSFGSSQSAYSIIRKAKTKKIIAAKRFASRSCNNGMLANLIAINIQYYWIHECLLKHVHCRTQSNSYTHTHNRT